MKTSKHWLYWSLVSIFNCLFIFIIMYIYDKHDMAIGLLIGIILGHQAQRYFDCLSITREEGLFSNPFNKTRKFLQWKIKNIEEDKNEN